MHSSSCITTRPYYVINVRLFEITDFDGANLMTAEQQAVKMGPYPKALQAIFAVEKSLRSHVEEECNNKGIPHDPVSKEMREMKMEPEPDVDFHEELKFSVQVSYYYIVYPNTSCIYIHITILYYMQHMNSAIIMISNLLSPFIFDHSHHLPHPRQHTRHCWVVWHTVTSTSIAVLHSCLTKE